MKKISYILCMLMASVMFTACSSDDLVENETMKMGHDKKGNYIDVTISADAPTAYPESRGIGTDVSMDRSWKENDKIVILLNGHRSELTIDAGSRTNNYKKATFSGRLYYGDILPDANTVLRAYIPTYYTKINDDGSYEMQDWDELNYGSAANSTGSNSDHNVYYAETKYGSGSQIAFNFVLKTAIIYIKFKSAGWYFVANTTQEAAKQRVYCTLEGNGLFGSERNQVRDFQFMQGINDMYNWYTIVDTRFPVSDICFKIELPDGREICRRLPIKVSPTRLIPGKIYATDFMVDPQVGDYLYSDGSWGDIVSANSESSMNTKKVVGIVFTGTHKSEKWTDNLGQEYSTRMLPPLAVALKDATTSVAYSSSTTTFPDEYKKNADQIISNAEYNDITDTYSRCNTLSGSYSPPSKAMSYSAGTTTKNIKWYLPSAGEMSILAQNMYDAEVVKNSTNQVYLNNLDKTKLNKQIDDLKNSSGQTAYTEMSGRFWTTTFSTKDGDAYTTQFPASGQNRIYGYASTNNCGVRAITQFGFVNDLLNQ